MLMSSRFILQMPSRITWVCRYHTHILILDPSKHLGPLKPSTLPAAEGAQDNQVALEKAEAKAEGDEDTFKLPPLEEVLSLHDFESLARRTMARRGWNYYSS